MPSHENIHRAYVNQDKAVLKDAGLIALNNAYNLLTKAKIYGNLLEMEALNTEFREQDKSLNNGVGTFEEKVLRLSDIGIKRSKCYNGFADDLIMFAAFESYINSYLLRNGFVVHVIDKDESKTKTLANRQKKRPIELTEVTEGTVFKPNSIGATIFMLDKYLDLLQPSTTAKKGLEKLKLRRNKTHFDAQIYAVSYYSSDFFEAFKFIVNRVEDDHKELFGA